MKIRNGFVSNSSSSSFIIGIVGINDDKLTEALEHMEKAEYNWDFQVMSQDEIAEELSQKYSSIHSHVRGGEEYLEIESFSYDSVELKDYKQYEYVVVMSETGNEPEYNYDTEEYEYDAVDFSDKWFTDDQLNRAAWIEAQGGFTSCGGGRDG